ncbi:PadR family transcriptional regulator [Nocardioides sp.]|uniref:PadR family transcriptional regulator n=1 Tax=Nocardioides sp. TaxID=35761 RepID=UPI002733303F|nr:PadR family transcriptional regulator [Nocardioides sp.]MDP3890049.1 PadR family transcriptional regulator [Nocardioides sp.]
MALEHALLVSLREQAGSGIELSRRFDKSIGFFWRATHQQIYRTLARMERDGWVSVETVAQTGRPDKKVYTVTPRGAEVLADWLAGDSLPEQMRLDIAVRIRGASFGDRGKVLAQIERHIDDHQQRLDAYREMAAAEYPDPAALTDGDLDRYLVLRGGILLEQGWIDWLTEYRDAHSGRDA